MSKISVNKKTKKSVLTATAGIVGLSSLPLLGLETPVLEAKSTTDIWPYPNNNLSIHFSYKANSSILNTSANVNIYTNPITPIYFNVPARSDTTDITNIGFNVSNRSIQAVSFIETRSIKYIGGLADRDNQLSDGITTFANNEIRKIYWNSSASYYYNISIGRHTFENNLLQSLDLPNKVVHIGDYAFYNNEITQIKGIENVTAINSFAFEKNKLVSSTPDGYVFKLPTNDNFKKITYSSFKDNNLTSITIPSNVISIEAYAFAENPITTVDFLNAGVEINPYMLGDIEPNKVTIFGHGNTSTAAKFAASKGYKYVNKEHYEYIVMSAEESKTKETYDRAVAEVANIEDSPVKKAYQERLNKLGYSYDAADAVTKAEQTLKSVDYLNALDLVNKLNTGTLKTDFTNRLKNVLLALNSARYLELKQQYTNAVNTNSLNADLLNKMKEELSSLGNTPEINALISDLNNQYDNSLLVTYKGAASRVESLKTYPTLRNVNDAQKWISMLPDGFEYNVTNKFIDTNEFLVDAQGNKVIDEVASYQVNETNDFIINAEGEKTLKVGLNEPTYITNPLYNIEQNIPTGEMLSKSKLQTDLDEISGPIFAEAAVNIAANNLTREKLDDALTLTVVLDDSPKKAALLKKIMELEEAFEGLEALLEDVEELKAKANTTMTSEDITSFEDKVNALPTTYLKEKYEDAIKVLKYKLEIKELKSKMNSQGPTEKDIDSLIILNSLLPSNDPDVISNSAEILEYQGLYDSYVTSIKKIANFFDNINPLDISTLNINKYNEIKALIRDLPDIYSEKEEFEQELNTVLIQLTSLQTTQNQTDLLKAQLDEATQNGTSVSKAELEAILTAINQVNNTSAFKELKKYFDTTVTKLTKDNISVTINNDTAYQNAGYIEQTKDIMSLLNSEALKDELKTLLDETLKTVLSKQITAFTTPSTEEFKKIQGLINTMNDSQMKATSIKALDTQAGGLVATLSNEMNVDDSTKNIDYISNLYEFAKNINDSSIRHSAYTAIDDSIDNHINSYFSSGGSSSVKNDIQYVQDLSGYIYSPTILNNVQNDADERISSHLRDYFSSANSSSLTENDIEYFQTFYNSYYNPSSINNPTNAALTELLENYFVENFAFLNNNNNNTNGSDNTGTDGSNGSNGSDGGSTPPVGSESNSTTETGITVIPPTLEQIKAAKDFLAAFEDIAFNNNYKGKIDQMLGDTLTEQLNNFNEENFNDFSTLNDITDALNNLDEGDLKAALNLKLSDALGAGLEQSLATVLKGIQDGYDFEPLNTLANEINQLPEASPLKQPLQDQLATFVDKHLDDIKKAAAKTTDFFPLGEFKSLLQNPELQNQLDKIIEEAKSTPTEPSDNEGNQHTSPSGSNNDKTESEKLSQEIEGMKEAIEKINSLQKMIELLTSMQSINNDKKDAPISNSLSNKDLQKLLEQLESKSTPSIQPNTQHYFNNSQLLEQLANSDQKIEDLGVIINELRIDLKKSQDKLEQLEANNQEFDEENYISLKAQLVSQQEGFKGLKNVNRGALIILILLGLYSVVSIRNNRKILGKVNNELKESREESQRLMQLLLNQEKTNTGQVEAKSENTINEYK